ncbi:hypothetical protein [Mycobacteroides salmoniphilum]|uniref:hypothetical protein n=1 Tax=Mycobacteroides salmoniphilum TaxID=404941 RepID=UPI00177CD4BB|nr:hypothetical protein [Mycobacteroides salmoniphilum]
MAARHSPFVKIFESSGEAGVQVADTGLLVGEGGLELGTDFGGKFLGSCKVV